jgi:carbamoyl-phosphate synthase large subunit
MKPLDGSASKGIFKIRNRKELLFFKDYVPRPILQEYVEGTEYTLDIFYDFSGKLRCIVPRKRIEVRAGEVSKAMVADNEKIVNEGWKAAECLKGCVGCINIQCFLTNDGTLKFVEINPRFGGGVPLSLKAGADFPRWIIEMARGNDPGDIRDAYRKNIYMLRYDDAVFWDGSALLEDE